MNLQTMIMKKNVFILSLAAGLFMLSGCASKKRMLRNLIQLLKRFYVAEA